MNGSYDIILKILTCFYGKRGEKIIVCLVLMIYGIKNSEIKESFGMSYDALRKYRASLESGSVEHLFIKKGPRMRCELDEHSDVIMHDFEMNPPKTLKEAQERIIRLTGIKRSLNRIRIFLKKRAFEFGQ